MAATATRRPLESQSSSNGSSAGLHNPYLNGRGERQHKSFQGFLRALKDTLDPERKGAALEAIHKDYGSSYVGPTTVAKALMGEESGVAGGYLVPIDYSLALLNVISERSFLLPRATQVPMSSRESSCPLFQTRTASGTAGVPSFFGNMAFKWGSSQAPGETEPAFEQLALTAWDLLGYSVLSNDFLHDAGPDAEDKIVKMFGSAAAWFLEYAFFQGLGASSQMPTGICGCPGKLLVTRQTTKTVTIQDITNMTASLLPFSWQNAIWACHPLALTPIQQLSQYFINIELGGMNHVQPRPAGALASLPIFVTDKLPAPGTGVDGDLVLFDPTLYIWGMRQDVVINVSMHPGFKTNQTDFRVWLRADGKPHVGNPITLSDQTTQVSPVVVLKGK